MTIAKHFISSTKNDEDRVMHSKSDNKYIMINDEAYEFFKKIFDSLKNRDQKNLELMKGREFLFDCVQLLYYKCRKINLNCGDSSD